MFCTNCGKEIEVGWSVCPNCGTPNENAEDTPSAGRKEFHFIGIRRRGKEDYQRLKEYTDVTVEGEKISVSSVRLFGKTHLDKQFFKQDVKSIDLPILPILRIPYCISLIILSPILLIITYGLGIFAVISSIIFMLSRHIRIRLKSGEVIKIPICQKADASEFLKELNYSSIEIQKNNSKKIEHERWLKRESLRAKILLGISGVAILAGLEMFSESVSDIFYQKTYIESVKEGSPNLYPNQTYGEEFEKFFQNTSWRYFEGIASGTTEDGTSNHINDLSDIVEFTGDYVGEDETEKVVMQFDLSKEDDTFEIVYLSINDIQQEDMAIVGLIEMIFGESEENTNTEESLARDKAKTNDETKNPDKSDKDEPDTSSNPVNTNHLEEADSQEIEMYLSNSSEALPLKVDNVYSENEYAGFTTIYFDEINISDADIKDATFGIVAWDSNMLPLELTGMYDYNSAYLYKVHSNNIAAQKTLPSSISLEEEDFKYMQILLLECSDFDGNTWTNPALSYYEENYAGKKLDINTMNALKFNTVPIENNDTDDTNTVDETDNTTENQEDTVSYTGDFFTDAGNGVLYGKDGVIVDANGNAIPEYADYFVTEEGYISNGDWCEEGYYVDSTGKVVSY